MLTITSLNNSVFDKGTTPHLDLVLSFQHDLSPSPSTFDTNNNSQPPSLGLNHYDGFRSRSRTHLSDSIFSWQQQRTLPVVEEDEVLESGEQYPWTGCSNISSCYAGSAWCSKTLHGRPTPAGEDFNSSYDSDYWMNEPEGTTVLYTPTLFAAKSLPSITLTVHRPSFERHPVEFIRESSSAPVHAALMNLSSGSEGAGSCVFPGSNEELNARVPRIGPVPSRSSSRRKGGEGKTSASEHHANSAEEDLAVLRHSPGDPTTSLIKHHRIKPVKNLRRFMKLVFSNRCAT
jgi:hypothetical protein